jgi:hypothetical protein
MVKLQRVLVTNVHDTGRAPCFRAPFSASIQELWLVIGSQVKRTRTQFIQ